jgi:hypothetical protein
MAIAIKSISIKHTTNESAFLYLLALVQISMERVSIMVMFCYIMNPILQPFFPKVQIQLLGIHKLGRLETSMYS